MKTNLGDERMHKFVRDFDRNVVQFVCLVVTDEKVDEGVLWLDGEEKSTPPVGYVSGHLPAKLLERKEIQSTTDSSGRVIYFNSRKHDEHFVLELADRV